jgi:hypothetical protein
LYKNSVLVNSTREPQDLKWGDYAGSLWGDWVKALPDRRPACPGLDLAVLKKEFVHE